MNAANSHKLILYTAILGQKAWGWGWRKWKCRGGGKLRKRAKGNDRLKGLPTWTLGANSRVRGTEGVNGVNC